MQNRNTETGYTLIETLVALTLLFILLFLVTELIPVISNKAISDLKLKAITACKNQMEETLATKNFIELTRELDKNLILNQTMDDQQDKILIIITVNHQKTGRELFTLKAFVEKTE